MFIRGIMKKFICKRLVSLLLTIVIAVLAAPVTLASSSTPSGWAEKEVKAAKQAGLVTEKASANYKKNITREEFCELVVRLYEKITNTQAVMGTDVFKDTDNQDVLKAYALGIVKGTETDIFSPNSLITRQEISLMIVRCIKAAIKKADTAKYNTSTFSDNNKISTWAAGAVYYTYDKGILKGVGDNSIDPLGKATCEQAIILVYRVYTSREKLSVNTGDIITFGGMKWRVLDFKEGGALLLSEYIIDWQPYNKNYKDLTWEYCSLRTYLNNDFYNSLPAVDRARIEYTTIINNDNPWFGTDGGSSTRDKVFLLSIEEAVRFLGDSGQLKNKNPNSEFFISDSYNSAKIAHNNISSVNLGIWTETYWSKPYLGFTLKRDALDYIKSQQEKAGWWWLRSPGSGMRSAAAIDPEGWLFVCGEDIDLCYIGVRPAVWVNL